jgi:hypothetical protein
MFGTLNSKNVCLFLRKQKNERKLPLATPLEEVLEEIEIEIAGKMAMYF